MTEATQAAVAAALLRQGRCVHIASAALGAGAIAGLLLAAGPFPAWVAAAILLAGAAETWMAVRVGLDAALFQQLADRARDGRLDLDGFDAAMTALGLLPAAKAGRALAPRLAGARRLLTLQAGALLVQLGLAVAYALLVAVRRVG